MRVESASSVSHPAIVRFVFIIVVFKDPNYFASRKNKFPPGDVMVMMFVPLAVLT